MDSQTKKNFFLENDSLLENTSKTVDLTEKTVAISKGVIKKTVELIEGQLFSQKKDNKPFEKKI